MYVNPYIKNTYRVKDKNDRQGYIRLDMNENPEGLPEEFVREVLKKIDSNFLAAYPRKETLLGMIAEREGIKKQNITLTNGSDEGMRLVFETFTRPGGRVVSVMPTFGMYQVYASMFGVQLDGVPFKDDFSIEVEDIVSSINQDTDLVVLLNPNSPIGIEFTEEECDKIILRAKEAGAFVLIDEAYYPFGVDSKINYFKEYPHVMILRTFSKICSLAALRVGYIIGDEEYIRYVENAQSTYNVNSVGILFAEELLKRNDIVENLKEKIDEGREYLNQNLEKSGYQYFGSKGNYVLIKPRKNPQFVADEMKKEKILIKKYERGILSDWIRITLGNKDIMEIFWKTFLRIEEPNV